MMMITPLKLELLDSLPSEVLVVPTEVAISSGLLVDWASQLQITNDATRAKIEVSLDDIEQLSISLATSGSAIGIHEHGEWVRHTNGIRDLDEHTTSELGSDE